MDIAERVAGVAKGITGFFASLKRASVERMERRRDLLREELKVAEKKFMKRKMDRKTYDEVVEEKQRKLIAVEAELEALNVHRQIDKVLKERGKKLSKHRQHNLADLLKDKDRVMKELKIAKKKYFKRKLNEKAYRSIVKANQKKLVGIEASIIQLYKDEARDVMAQTGQQLARLKQEQAEQYVEEIAGDITEEK